MNRYCHASKRWHPYLLSCQRKLASRAALNITPRKAWIPAFAGMTINFKSTATQMSLPVHSDYFNMVGKLVSTNLPTTLNWSEPPLRAHGAGAAIHHLILNKNNLH